MWKNTSSTYLLLITQYRTLKFCLLRPFFRILLIVNFVVYRSITFLLFLHLVLTGDRYQLNSSFVCWSSPRPHLLQALRLFLVWDSEGIETSEDRVLEQIFESVDEESDSDSEGSKDKKDKGKAKGKKDKKQKKKSAKSSDSMASDGSSSSSSKAKFMRSILVSTHVA